MASELEVILNKAKDKLADPRFEQLKKQSAYENSVRTLRADIAKRYNAQHVTKGWLKGAELIGSPQVLASFPTDRPIKAYFNAELPGGFVFAANHILNGRLDWIISSFWPRSSTTGQKPEADYLEDMYGLLKNNPQRNIVGTIRTKQGDNPEFLFWNTGDMTDDLALKACSQLANSKLGKVDLYTADGGFGVAGKESEQEVLSFPLILGEVKLGLSIIAPGGVIIIKMFTIFQNNTLGLIISLASYFNKIELIKPSFSSPLNSEVYFVGVGFNPIARPYPDITNYLLKRRDELVRDEISAINRLMDTGETKAIVWNGPPLDLLPNDKHIPSDK
jgi:cap2 methyltransferase